MNTVNDKVLCDKIFELILPNIPKAYDSITVNIVYTGKTYDIKWYINVGDNSIDCFNLNNGKTNVLKTILDINKVIKTELLKTDDKYKWKNMNINYVPGKDYMIDYNYNISESAFDNNDIMELDAVFTSYIGNFTNGNYEIQLDVSKIRDILGRIFGGKICTDVLYTRNTDNIFFGIRVNPTITPDDFMSIVFGDDDFVINRYAVELDSKLFDVGLESMEIIAYLLYEISSMIDNSAPTWDIRKIIDYRIAIEDDIINIRQGVNYSQLLILAIKDALSKVTSIMYKDIDGVLSNQLINKNELQDFLISALNKIRSSVFGVGAVVKEPDVVLLAWAFTAYKDAKLYTKDTIMTLRQSKLLTGSRLDRSEIDKAIKSLQRVTLDINLESSRIINEAKNKGGLFVQLKKNGLRAIEDDLYELTVRAKNAEDEDDVYYTIRQINTRLNMLEEYMYDEDNNLSDRELEKWRKVALAYRELRAELAKKKLSKKVYGLWYDYEKLDSLD